MRSQFLLIVPCGIETTLLFSATISYFLLIVPCGIETKCLEEGVAGHVLLLIVPCGIETNE